MRSSLKVLILALVLLTLAACTPAAAPAPSDEEGPIRVALVTSGPVTDLAFAQTMYQNLLAVQEELGDDQVEIAFSENMFKIPDATAAIRDYASQGYDIVIAHSAIFGGAVKQLAPEFPEVSFAWGPQTDTFQQDGIENVYAYRAQVEEAGYILGVISALTTETDIVGVCGPVEASDAKRYIDSYVAAVEATRPEVEVNVIYTGSFTDAALSAAAAETHIAAGADILTGIAAALPCMNAAKEHGLNYFAVQGDWTQLEPETVAASVVYNWTDTLKDMIATNRAGVLGGKIFFLSLLNGGLDIVYSDQVEISDEVKAAADAAFQGIADDTITLP